jgi:hypothetical protein
VTRFFVVKVVCAVLTCALLVAVAIVVARVKRQYRASVVWAVRCSSGRKMYCITVSAAE